MVLYLAHAVDVILAKSTCEASQVHSVRLACNYSPQHPVDLLGCCSHSQSLTSLTAVVPKHMQAETAGTQVGEHTHLPFSLSRWIGCQHLSAPKHVVPHIVSL